MKWLITGGAGFIGCNSAKALLYEGHNVVIFDNLSRKGSKQNLDWLKEKREVEFVKGDVRNFEALKSLFQEYRRFDVVLHLAAQVAVTTSVANPREDFEVNALGTFNVCEAVRRFNPEAILLNASTNKVYGELENIKTVEKKQKYEFLDYPEGISENMILDFHSPYGCSKGAGDQYIRDYSRIYGLRTVNFRQSCIYGYRQFGIEDQGWVAWFAICGVFGRKITIYGDGKQVRDILFIDDLVDCYVRSVQHINKASGQAYNIGGGPNNTMSPLRVIAMLEEILGTNVKHSFSDWRPGDQRVFVCNVKKAEQDLNWKPQTSTQEGLGNLVNWIVENKSLLKMVI